METVHSDCDWQAASIKLGNFHIMPAEPNPEEFGANDNSLLFEPGDSVSDHSMSGAGSWESGLVSPQVGSESTGGGSVHSNPNWFAQLEASFVVKFN